MILFARVAKHYTEVLRQGFPWTPANALEVRELKGHLSSRATLQDSAQSSQCPVKPVPSQAGAQSSRCPVKPVPSQAGAQSSRCPVKPVPSQAGAQSSRCPVKPVPSQAGAQPSQCPAKPVPSQWVNALMDWKTKHIWIAMPSPLVLEAFSSF